MLVPLLNKFKFQMKSFLLILTLSLISITLSAQTPDTTLKQLNWSELENKENASFPVSFNYQKHLIEFVQNYTPKIRNLQKDTVDVQIDVDTAGVISNVTIVRSAHAWLEHAALDFVRTWPQMVPANQEGRKVKSRTTIPIVFPYGKEKDK